jgi:hypothetical protein
MTSSWFGAAKATHHFCVATVGPPIKGMFNEIHLLIISQKSTGFGGMFDAEERSELSLRCRLCYRQRCPKDREKDEECESAREGLSVDLGRDTQSARCQILSP